jgi:uncharacterized protein involved in exopolysaccharide biosynthesis
MTTFEYNSLMIKPLSPAEIVDSSLRNWWVVFVLMMAGSLVGYAIHAVRPAEYESDAAITVGIDYVQTGAMNDTQQDQALNAVGDVIQSPDVVNRVVEDSAQVGYPITEEQFQQYGVAQREGYRWVLQVRSPNPKQSEELANLWVEQSLNVLQDALAHAKNSDVYNTQLSGLESCFQSMTVAVPAYAPCNLSSAEQLREQMTSLAARVIEERQASDSILSSLSFTINQQAVASTAPVIYNRNVMVFSGAIIGLILGIWLNYLGLSERIVRSLSRG